MGSIHLPQCQGCILFEALLDVQIEMNAVLTNEAWWLSNDPILDPMDHDLRDIIDFGHEWAVGNGAASILNVHSVGSWKSFMGSYLGHLPLFQERFEVVKTRQLLTNFVRGEFNIKTRVSRSWDPGWDNSICWSWKEHTEINIGSFYSKWLSVR